MYNPYDAYDRSEWYKADAIMESRQSERLRFTHATPTTTTYQSNLKAAAASVAAELKAAAS